MFQCVSVCVLALAVQQGISRCLAHLCKLTLFWNSALYVSQLCCPPPTIPAFKRRKPQQALGEGPTFSFVNNNFGLNSSLPPLPATHTNTHTYRSIYLNCNFFLSLTSLSYLPFPFLSYLCYRLPYYLCDSSKSTVAGGHRKDPVPPHWPFSFSSGVMYCNVILMH